MVARAQLSPSPRQSLARTAVISRILDTPGLHGDSDVTKLNSSSQSWAPWTIPGGHGRREGAQGGPSEQ